MFTLDPEKVLNSIKAIGPVSSRVKVETAKDIHSLQQSSRLANLDEVADVQNEIEGPPVTSGVISRNEESVMRATQMSLLKTQENKPSTFSIPEHF